MIIPLRDQLKGLVGMEPIADLSVFTGLRGVWQQFLRTGEIQNISLLREDRGFILKLVHKFKFLTLTYIRASLLLQSFTHLIDIAIEFAVFYL